MKGKFSLLCVLALGLCLNLNAQNQDDVSKFTGQDPVATKYRFKSQTMKRIALEGSVGLINGNSPSSGLKPLVGEIGVRYSLSDAFSMKLASEFGKFDYSDVKSNFFNVTAQAYVNILQLTGASTKANKFNVYFIGGLGVYQNSFEADIEGVESEKVKDKGINALAGVQFAYKVSDNIALNLTAKQVFLAMGDLSLDGTITNARAPQNNYQTVSLGVSYFLGGKKSKNAKHADWARREFISKDMLVQALEDYDKQQKADEAKAIAKAKDEVEKNTASKADVQQAVATVSRQTDEKIKNAGGSAKQLEELINKKYLMVYFPVGKSVPEDDAAFAINFVYTYLKEHPNKKVKIVGHTDNTGSVAVNQKLSEKRANYVLSQLVNMGISKDRLSVDSKGKSESRVENNTKASKAINRRVEFVIE
ncbi:OmpA family protein [Aureibacter tunicatorum]|uniref:OOP family OmpA-OmpF porin n=1 Tax=Aureibacter tunicatorum TaxID=866807 RepID=A0AAE3XRN8_9BACT|nr:OmpA family protein [Aureibacter tunicatorum]MDR6240779.1 OOP family OmpA-OmpF porin [Aureibacter tunicatorum]BDD06888.1 hypothetical protein AUTU_43710 [Aureibacter tunicatorum]